MLVGLFDTGTKNLPRPRGPPESYYVPSNEKGLVVTVFQPSTKKRYRDLGEALSYTPLRRIPRVPVQNRTRIGEASGIEHTCARQLLGGKETPVAPLVGPSGPRPYHAGIARLDTRSGAMRCTCREANTADHWWTGTPNTATVAQDPRSQALSGRGRTVPLTPQNRRTRKVACGEAHSTS
jgi:hypothetical protein